MSKDLNVSRLCDAYGALLTEHRLEILRSYYDDDLSLAEIAENFGITRQAALCSIKQAEKQLNSYEQKLGLLAKSDKIEKSLAELDTVIDSDIANAQAKLKQLLNELRQ